MNEADGTRSRNPVLVGCLVVVALVLVGGGAAAYYFIGRPALAAVTAARDLARIQRIESGINNRASYTPPADGLLTQRQVDGYLAVSRSVYDSLEARVGLLDERYRDLNGRSASFAGIRQVASAWADLIRLVVEAKETQVNALNATDFSLAEYAWVRSQVLRAAGLPYFEVDLAALMEQGGDMNLQPQLARAPDANVGLVAPYADELERLVPLAVFGL